MPKGSQGAASRLAQATSSEIRGQMARRRVGVDDLVEPTGLSRSYLYKRLRDELPFNLNDVGLIGDALGVDAFTILADAARAAQEEETPRAARRGKTQREIEGSD